MYDTNFVIFLVNLEVLIWEAGLVLEPGTAEHGVDEVGHVAALDLVRLRYVDQGGEHVLNSMMDSKPVILYLEIMFVICITYTLIQYLETFLVDISSAVLVTHVIDDPNQPGGLFISLINRDKDDTWKFRQPKNNWWKVSVWRNKNLLWCHLIGPVASFIRDITDTSNAAIWLVHWRHKYIRDVTGTSNAVIWLVHALTT